MYSNGYQYRSTLLIDHTKVSSDLTNFPVVVNGTYPWLATVANGGGMVNSSGYDMLFTDEVGNTVPYELEGYTASTGALTTWIGISSLSSSSDTRMYLYYGNSNVSTAPVGSTIWDSDYLGVYHMNDTGSSIQDSVYNNSGRKVGISFPVATSSILGQGQNFILNAGGSGNYVALAKTVGNSYSFNDFNTSIWSMRNTLGALQFPVGIYFGSQNGIRSGSVSFNANNSLSGNFRNAAAQEYAITTSAGSNPGISTWEYIVYRKEGLTLSLIVNGSSKYYTSNAIGSTSSSLGAAPTPLGSREGSTLFFNGVLDEVRFSKIARSEAWALTEYKNQSSPSTFYSLTGNDQSIDTLNTHFSNNTIAGASYLNTRGIISLSEGFNDGVSSHVVDIGRFEIDQMDNSGFDGSVLNLSASAVGSKLSNSTFAYNKEFKGQRSYYQDFLTQDSALEVTSNYGSSLGISNSSLIFPAIDSTGTVITFNDIDIRDGSYTLKLSTDRWSNSTYIEPFMRYHDSDFAYGMANTFLVNATTWAIRTIDLAGAAHTLVSGNLGISLANYTPYWFNFRAKGSELKLSFSTSGTGAWSYLGGVLGITASLFSRSTESGKVGIRGFVQDATETLFSVDSAMVSEISPVATRDTIFKSIYNGQGLQYSPSNLITGFSPYWVGSSTWDIGTSGSVTINNLGTGNSWNYYQTIGNTFTDFVAYADITGVTNGPEHHGIYFGTTNSPVGFYVRNLGLGSTLICDWWEQTPTAFHTDGIPSMYMKGSSTLYTIGLVKQGTLFTALLNGIAISSFKGSSVYNSNNNLDYNENLITPSGAIGVWTYGGITGNVTFSNFRISAFNELQNDITFNQGSGVQSAIDSLLVEDDIIVNTPDGVYLTKKGISQGIHTLGLSGGYMSGSRVIDYSNVPYKNNYIKNKSLSATSVYGNSLAQYQADSSKSDFIYGRDNLTIGQAQNTLQSNKTNTASSIDTIPVAISGRPSLEVNDSIILINDTLGVSDLYTVMNFSKTMDFMTSEFAENITLKKIQS